MGNTFDVKIAPAAMVQLAKLPRPVQKKILDRIESLEGSPLPDGVEMISNDPRFWRLRVDDYRVIYWLDEDTSVIITLIVRHREDAYRDLDKLDPTIIGKGLAPFLNGVSPLMS